jgi:nitronate monooxygenase
LKPLYLGDLKIPIPIVQGGMGVGISLSGLASAVANMGGVGVIATVGVGVLNSESGANYKQTNIEALKAEIRKAREKTNGILGVNVMTVLTNFSDMVKTSIDEGIDIIFSGAGLPLDLPKYLKEGVKTKLVPIVSSARAAKLLCNKWLQNYNYLPDALVVEGPKAGGHLGFKSVDIEKEELQLEALVDEVLEVTSEVRDTHNKNIPVIAAGGIFDGKDVFDMINRGASAVQLGTRFVTTEECDASDEFKNAIVNAEHSDVKLIVSPVGLPGRALGNEFLIETAEEKRRPKVCKYNCIKSCNPKTTLYCIMDALLSAYRGRLNDGFVFTGANAGRIKAISTVKNLFTELKEEYQEALQNSKKLNLNK